MDIPIVVDGQFAVIKKMHNPFVWQILFVDTNETVFYFYWLNYDVEMIQ